MAGLRSHSASLIEAKEALKKNPGHNGALRVQRIKQERQKLRDKLPPLQLIQGGKQ